MTVNCDRLEDVAFSAPYFRTGQQVLAPKSSKITGYDGTLAGKKICRAGSGPLHEVDRVAAQLRGAGAHRRRGRLSGGLVETGGAPARPAREDDHPQVPERKRCGSRADCRAGGRRERPGRSAPTTGGWSGTAVWPRW
ncbi:hypothetical protein SVIOM342S_08474 [Streptomyces violaceorubidus]